MPKRKPPPWTAEEIAILEDVYVREGINGATDALPDRSWHAIHQMAHKRGIRCQAVTPAPKGRLQGAQLAEAVRLREQDGWSFARIGATFGICEASACNCVMIELCRRKGFNPAQRDGHGRLTAEGVERLRFALRKGLKGIDIQLRLGICAGRVALERRRYNAELKARGKAALPPPGGGIAYSGVKLSREDRKAVEDLFLEGFGTQKISERTGVSKTSITRIRNRLIKRLARKGETLPGCDRRGRRSGPAKEHLRAVPAQAIAALRERLLAGEPCARSARDLGIGGSRAYRVRTALVAELAERGETLPAADWRSVDGRLAARIAARRADWLPPEWFQRHRELVHAHGLEEAKRLVLAEIVAARRAAAERPKIFEEQLARVAAGASLVTRVPLRRPDPAGTLGGVATGALM